MEVRIRPVASPLSAGVLLFFLASALPAQTPYAPANPEWNRKVEPFRIVGNLYYVGASDVSSYLIASSEGLILLDTGFRETAPMVESNIEKLGFRLEDVRLLLITHGHYDHVGGLAEIKDRTHARLLANPLEAPLLSRGGLGDFAFGDSVPYPPVEPDGLLRDGQEVRLAGTVLTAHFTPGHTKGCTSWSTTIEENGTPYHVVIACSVTAPDYRLVDNPLYPQILGDFVSTFATLRSLPCNVFLGGHSWEFGLPQKMAARGIDPARNPFVDPQGYRRFIDTAEAAIGRQASEQRRR